MSDLQCPTRLLVAPAGSAEDGPDRARRLGERLGGERVARVWSGPSPGAVRTAEAAAGVLGVDVVVHRDLRRPDAGESAAGAGARVALVLDELRDTHRGEAVLVVLDQDALPDAVARVLATGTDPGYVGLEGDADGWRLVSR